MSELSANEELQALRAEVEKLSKKRRPWFVRLPRAVGNALRSFLERAAPTGEDNQKALAEYPKFVQRLVEKRSRILLVIVAMIVALGAYGALLASLAGF